MSPPCNDDRILLGGFTLNYIKPTNKEPYGVNLVLSYLPNGPVTFGAASRVVASEKPATCAHHVAMIPCSTGERGDA